MCSTTQSFKKSTPRLLMAVSISGQWAIRCFECSTLPRHPRRAPDLTDQVAVLLLIFKISSGCTLDFRVNMWGTSLPEDKLAGDLGTVIEATSIRGRRSDFSTVGKLAPGHLGLLQQYRHDSEAPIRSENVRLSGLSGSSLPHRRFTMLWDQDAPILALPHRGTTRSLEGASDNNLKS